MATGNDETFLRGTIAELLTEPPVIQRNVDIALLSVPKPPKPKLPLLLLISAPGQLEQDLADLGFRAEG